MEQNNASTDDEYHYECTECGHSVETEAWREAVDCPECGAGKLVTEESQNR